MELVARNALQLLSHTPVSALGINFGFIENDPSTDLLRTFDLSDSGSLGDAGYEVQKTSITRQITKEGTAFVSKVTYENGKVRFHFNFNHPIASAEEGVRFLQGRVLQCRNIATTFLTTIFHLQEQEVS
jgi:hypothetical protein